MTVLGMGPLEILVILLVAFIFLGPQRMVDVARMMGKATREIRRMTDELPSLIMEEETASADKPIVHRGGGANPASPDATAEEETAPPTDDGPVAHQRSGATEPEELAEAQDEEQKS